MNDKIIRLADFAVAVVLSDDDHADLIASARTDLGDFLTLRAIARNFIIEVEPDLAEVENEIEDVVHDLLHQEL